MSIDTEKAPEPELSSETRQLVDLCLQVHQGAVDRAAELESHLHERQTGLSAAWDNFAPDSRGASVRR